MGQQLGGWGRGRGKFCGVFLLLVSGAIASCSGGEPPAAPAPATPAPITSAPESAPTVTPAPATPVAPAPVPATTPAPTEAGSTFVGENFTVTITGFGAEAGYKGCDKQGQCLEISPASSYENGSYTWENSGYVYLMQGVARGDYRLEVRDPQGKVLVDEAMRSQPGGF